jgi:hypothetical protein
MLALKRLFQRRHDGSASINGQRDLKQVFQDQNELVALNESIADSKEALQKGRGALGRALLGTTEERESDSSAVALLEAGRQGLLQQMTATTDATRIVQLEAGSARFLADELHAQLVALTSSLPKDRLAAKSLEIQIQTALRAYSSSVQRLLIPLTFR